MTYNLIRDKFMDNYMEIRVPLFYFDGVQCIS